MKKLNIALVIAFFCIKSFCATVSITTTNFAFNPATVTISAGDVVSFTNIAGFHNVQWLSAPAGFSLPATSAILSSTPIDYTLTTTGTYTLQCGVHLTSMPLTIIVQPAIQPIKLKSFSIANIDESYLLKWVTETETNVSNFVLERAEDNLIFKQIAVVNAKGNSSELSNYEFEDNNLPRNSTIIYYRLKSVDLDAKYEYSPIIAAKIFSKLEMKVYPNPSSSIVMFEGGDHDFHHTINDISIFNTLGNKILGPISMHIQDGIGMFDLDVSNYQSGKYVAIIDNKIGMKKYLSFLVSH